MLSSTGVRPSTSASGSRPSGNNKKNKIQRPSSSTLKNKVEAHPRTVKSSLKHKNYVVKPKETANVQHFKINANSKLLCVKCNGCMLSANHDLCVLDFLDNISVNARAKSKSVKKVQREKFRNQQENCSQILYTLGDHIESIPSLKLTAMASEHSSSGPVLHEMTLSTISSRLVPNPPTSTPFVPPLRNDWDLLFQPLFDELLNLSSSFDRPAPEVIAPIVGVVAPVPATSTGSPSSKTVDQDVP
ncbi:hypothetical protein Tco_1178173 [Tanacetum coccineum]